MIHFDFTVEDHEAEAIFDCINQCIYMYQDAIFDLVNNREDQCLIDTHYKQMEYFKILKTKMLNYKI